MISKIFPGVTPGPPLEGKGEGREDPLAHLLHQYSTPGLNPGYAYDTKPF